MATDALAELKKFILEELVQKDGLLMKILSPEGQYKLAAEFAKTLSAADISLANLDIKNDNTRETLKMGCRAQAAQMLEPSLNVDMRPALKPLMKKENDEEKEVALENSLIKTLKALLTLKLSQAKNPPSDEDKMKMEMKLKTDAKSHTKDKNASSILSCAIDKLLRECAEDNERKSLYGGINPEKGSGQVQTTVQGVQGGNQFGRQDLSNTGETWFAELGNANSDKPDPNAVHASSVVNALMDGVMTAHELGLQQKGVIPDTGEDAAPGLKSSTPTLTIKNPGQTSR